MNTYKYRARSIEDDKSVNGVIEAYSEFEAVAQIKARNLIVEKITPMTEKQGIHVDLNEPLWVSDKVLALTASQFAIMLKAGLPMGRVVQLIADQTSDKLMKKILTACAQDVQAGFSLAQSLEKNGKKIPAAFIETVRAGEESGSLEVCFLRLQTYYEKAHRVKRKVRSALTYPIILILMAVVVVGVVMVVLVPTMTGMFEGAGQELPGVTQFLMNVSDFFVAYWPIVFGALAGVIIAIKMYSKTPAGAMAMGRLKMKLPVIGKIGIMNAASQFANTVCVLLTAGLPITRVIAITSRVVDNVAVGKTLDEAVAQLEEGKRLATALKDNPYLPPMLIEMVSVGEDTGALEDTMDTIGSYYDEEAEAASSKALGMLEPMITIFLGVFIGFIVIAIYMPMFTMETLIAG